MAELHVVAGLPGSGKSTWAVRAARDKQGYAVEDYFRDSLDGTGGVTSSRHYAVMLLLLKQGIPCYVADVAFCDQQRRDEFICAFEREVSGVRVECHFTANQPARCRQNAVDRAAKRLAGDLERIEQLTKVYGMAGGCQPIPVHRPYERREAACCAN